MQRIDHNLQVLVAACTPHDSRNYVVGGVVDRLAVCLLVLLLHLVLFRSSFILPGWIAGLAVINGGVCPRS
ncbi:hypothetical protein V1522DRAFT_399195 [Lipomyces starkeyi]